MAIIADWRFSPQYALEGSLEEGDLILKDNSGFGNHLQLVTLGDRESEDIAKVLKWSNLSYSGKFEEKSLTFENRRDRSVARHFCTLNEAPLNEELFEQGFTIEVLYKFPTPDIGFDPWTGILTRQGAASEIGKNDGEKEILTTLSISNIPEFQWTSHPLNASENYTNWSMPIEDTAHFQYITIVNDGLYTTMYINGIKDIRDPKEEMKGIDFVPGKGWEIGHLLSGNIERIRIANKALTREEWIVQDPTVYLKVEGNQTGGPLLTYEDSYQFAIIPDTQYMVEYKPEMFVCMMEWLVKNTDTLHLKMTAHLGDITQSGAEIELVNADEAFKLFDKKNMPYLVTPGNHDYRGQDTLEFIKYFGSKRVSEKAYYGGASESSLSMYGIIEAGSYSYLFLSLDSNSEESLARDLTWAKEVLAAHPNNPTILFTHDAYYPIEEGITLSSAGSIIWDELVKVNNQVFMVIGGHYNGAGHRISQNVYGSDVLELLVDYQSFPSGGNGWLRLVEFNERKGIMKFTTYSPWVESIPEHLRSAYDWLYLDNRNDAFIISWNFSERFLF